MSETEPRVEVEAAETPSSYGTIHTEDREGFQMSDSSQSRADDALLDLEHKSNEELRELLDDLYEEEQRVSYRRRVLHGKIDILRSELVRRLKGEHDAGGDVIGGQDVERLIEILANDLRGVSRFDVTSDDAVEDDAE
jgi:hypothetical protein